MSRPEREDRHSGAEFDRYARAYASGMENSIKALFGNSADDFIAVKLSWLLWRFPDLRDADGSFRILDYGCGTAAFLRLMTEAGFAASLTGCDVSSGMLNEARRRWPAGVPHPDLYEQKGATIPLETASVDLVIVSAVLHHVTPERRSTVYFELERILRPGGWLVVFDHNPLNPVTRYVVRHTAIDENAILLRAGEVSSALRAMQFDGLQTRYLMFAPPRLSVLLHVERWLGWLPLGGQYAVTAQRR